MTRTVPFCRLSITGHVDPHVLAASILEGLETSRAAPSAHMKGAAHLDDGGRYEDGRLAARKGGQGGGLLIAAQPSVQEAYPGAA